MKEAIHPGIYIRDKYVKPFNLTRKLLGEYLGVTYNIVSHILGGSTEITIDMAHRLEQVLPVNAKELLIMQLDYNLSKYKNNNSLKRLNLSVRKETTENDRTEFYKRKYSIT